MHEENLNTVDREHFRTPDTLLIIRIGLNGKINDVNDSFLEASGFNKDELIGSDYKLIIHDQVPATVSEDLWQSLRYGLPWNAQLKIRHRRDDFFWVEADTNFVYDRGRLQGYMLVLSLPNSEKIDATNQYYDRLKSNKKKSKVVDFFNNSIFKIRLTIGHKIALLGLLMVIPSLVLIKVLVDDKNIDIQRTQVEIEGLEYVTPLKQVLAHLAEHRSLTNSYLNQANEEKHKKIDAINLLVTDDIKLIDSIDLRYGVSFKSTEMLTEIKEDWERLQKNSLKLVIEDNYSQHNNLIDKIKDLLETISSNSSLTLDSNSVTHYLITIALVLEPELIDNLYNFTSINIINAAKGGQLSQQSKTQIAVLDQRIRNQSLKIINNLSIVYQGNEALKSVLQNNQDDFSMKVIGILNAIKRDIYNVDTITVSSEIISQQSIGALNSVDLFDKSIISLLQSGLVERKNELENTKNAVLMTSVILIVVIFFIGYVNISSIVKTLREIIKIFTRIIEGNFKNEIQLNKYDELGDVLRELYLMQVSLNVNISESRDQLVKTTRIQRALDNSNSCVMLSDNKSNIIYTNNALKNLFDTAEYDNCDEFRDFKSKVFSENIEKAFEKLNFQYSISKIKSTLQSEIKIGNRYFNLIFNPVTDSENNKIGTVIEWIDRTLEVKTEEEIKLIVEAVKAGELNGRLSLTGKQGFFHMLSVNINELTDVIDQVFGDIASIMRAMSDGDLSKRMENDFEGVYESCKNDINTTLAKLSDVFFQIDESAQIIINSSDEIASGNNNLSHHVEEQASRLEENAHSMEELSSTVKNNAENAHQADVTANYVQQLAENGGNIVKSAIEAMREINESSNKISNIITIIDEIAFQTNLLALNAAVEAARAGEQGRGFSVVANEVRNLAQRCANAAQESKVLIQNSIDKVRVGTSQVNESGKSLDDIVIEVKKVGEIISNIASASLEQSTGIDQVNQSIAQLNKITQQNAALAEQTAASSISMNDQSKHMMRILEFFHIAELGRH